MGHRISPIFTLLVFTNIFYELGAYTQTLFYYTSLHICVFPISTIMTFPRSTRIRVSMRLGVLNLLLLLSPNDFPYLYGDVSLCFAYDLFFTLSSVSVCIISCQYFFKISPTFLNFFIDIPCPLPSNLFYAHAKCCLNF